MAEKKQESAPPLDEKVVFVRTKGGLTRRWRKMLREEGGTESYHSQRALELYVGTKGY